MKAGPMNNIRRGNVFWVNFDPSVGSEIKKLRPALVVSNNSANINSSRIIAAPITSKIKKVYLFEVLVQLPELQGKILLDQIKSFDKSRIKEKITSLDYETMMRVDEALKIALDLN